MERKFMPAKEKSKRKLLFTKQSQIMNVLPYYAKVAGCDILMRKLSQGSRKIWVNYLKIWIDYLPDNMLDIDIGSNNIGYFSSDLFFYNYRLTFYSEKLLESPLVSDILHFIETIPSQKQIKKIAIKNYNCYNSSFWTETHMLSLIDAMNRISGALGDSPQKCTTKKEKDITFYIYISDIFSVLRSHGIAFHRLIILPKVKSEWKFFQVESCYFLSSDYIILCPNNQDHLSDVLYLKSCHPQTSRLEDVNEIRPLKKHHDIISIKRLRAFITKCYPNLQKIVSCSPIETISNRTQDLVDIIMNTEIQLFSQVSSKSSDCYVKASNAIIGYNRRKNIYIKVRSCNIDVDIKEFILKDDHLYSCKFTAKCVKNIQEIEIPPKIFENLVYLEEPRNRHRYHFPLFGQPILVIPLRHISFVRQRFSCIGSMIDIRYDPPSHCDCSSSDSSCNSDFLQDFPFKSCVPFHSALAPDCSFFLTKFSSRSVTMPINLQALNPFIARTTIQVEMSSSNLSWILPKLKILAKCKVVDLVMKISKKASKDRVKKCYGMIEGIATIGNLRTVHIKWDSKSSHSKNRRGIRLELPPNIEVYENWLSC